VTGDGEVGSDANSFEPASIYLEAALVPRRGSLVTKAARTVLTIAVGLLTNDLEAGPSAIELVVRRTSTGNEILRVVAGTPSEADALLAKVRGDLAAKSVSDFLTDWRDNTGQPRRP